MSFNLVIGKQGINSLYKDLYIHMVYTVYMVYPMLAFNIALT